MKAEELYLIFKVRPFQPMRIHLKDGRRFDIPARELVIVGVNFLDIGIQAPGQPEGVWETGVTVPLGDIDSLEPIPARAAS